MLYGAFIVLWPFPGYYIARVIQIFSPYDNFKQIHVRYRSTSHGEFCYDSKVNFPQGLIIEHQSLIEHRWIYLPTAELLSSTFFSMNDG